MPELLTEVADSESSPVTVTSRRAKELRGQVRKHGVSSLSPEELEEWRVVERWSAKLAANPAWQQVKAALNDQQQHRAFVKADRIIRQLPRHEQALYERLTPADFLALHASAKTQGRPVARSRESRPGRRRRTRSSRASRDGPEPEPEPPPLARRCAHCGDPIIGRRADAQYCDDSCKTLACRKRRETRLAADPALERRYEAARELAADIWRDGRVGEHARRDELLELLEAVVWPRSPRLLEAA